MKQALIDFGMKQFHVAIFDTLSGGDKHIEIRLDDNKEGISVIIVDEKTGEGELMYATRIKYDNNSKKNSANSRRKQLEQRLA